MDGPELRRGEEGSLTRLSLAEASELLRNRKVSPVRPGRGLPGRIEALNPKLNAFITVMANGVSAAREAEPDS
jgi:Asp-tRNA(Asn)/Glu-tRNA(Gln) amidotransferase A subunit family amidase